ncbi:hypothetical protein FGO68_gene11415 [Halteria grandinella]|uniref:Uncharacterized protein n=1 Tax=Halteria grandinella TaxID=5974 RepID=A0A8J8P5Q1_HALGN|nr:hypothetical protein FGO68_gene11415 [Halteria grandinella]
MTAISWVTYTLTHCESLSKSSDIFKRCFDFDRKFSKMQYVAELFEGSEIFGQREGSLSTDWTSSNPLEQFGSNIISE